MILIISMVAAGENACLQPDGVYFSHIQAIAGIATACRFDMLIAGIPERFFRHGYRNTPDKPTDKEMNRETPSIIRYARPAIDCGFFCGIVR